MSPNGNLWGDYKEDAGGQKSLPGNLRKDVFTSTVETAGNFPNI